MGLVRQRGVSTCRGAGWDDVARELERETLCHLPGDEGGALRKEVVEDGLKEAVAAAEASDAAIVIVGNHPLINGKEEIDRPDLTLAASQERLIREVFKVNPNTIVVVIGSYPFALNWVDKHIPAVLYSSHAGQELGNALADVLFGDYNPAGRLNMTWYRSVEQLPDIMDYDIRKGKRTYQYFDGEPLYPFGYGLSYTTFRYDELSVSLERAGSGRDISVSVRVENSGDRAGDEVVQLYVRADSSRVREAAQRTEGLPAHPSGSRRETDRRLYGAGFRAGVLGCDQGRLLRRVRYLYAHDRGLVGRYPSCRRSWRLTEIPCLRAT